MEYISSDTNVWLDFVTINRLELPFKLPYIYLMNDEAVDDELLNPPSLGEDLIDRGLRKTQLAYEEFILAGQLTNKYIKLSLYDCVALAIAKVRKITLLTGDGALRKAAKAEKVEVIGTIGILDQLLENQCINAEEFSYCIHELLKNNGGKFRLPAA